MLAHDARPHAARGAELRDLFQKIAVRVEEERQPRRELVDVESGVDGRLHIGHAVAQREGDFLHGGRSGLAHVIAGDRNRVPLGNVLVGPGKHVGDDAHGLLRRIDVGAARDVFLEHIVLHGAGELADVGALPPRDRDVERQQDRRGRVDGHRGGNFRQLDAVEQALHVFDGIDGDADLADFARRPADGRSQGRSAWADRRRPRGRWCRSPADICSACWIPRRRPCRRTGAWSRGGRGTWWPERRG